jgi:hypothetical protein
MRIRCEPGGVAGRVGSFRGTIGRDPGVRPAFPPAEQAEVTAVACELTSESGEPLSRQSLGDVCRRVAASRPTPMSRSTVWRLLDRLALKPWRYRYWIFPRDPKFFAKASRILDLYAGVWDGQPLGPNDFVLSSDEKTSIQARLRTHSSLPPEPGRVQRIEFEYERGGALQYLAAWDVFRGLAMGRCEPKTGIEPFMRLVDDVMQQEPYRSADRVFWVVDNGSSHRGQTAIDRLKKAWPNAVMVHTPVHASWLNQVEIYFSIVQRKVLTPNDFTGLDDVADRLLRFQDLINAEPQPFSWNYTRIQLAEFLTRLNRRLAANGRPTLSLAA